MQKTPKKLSAPYANPSDSSIFSKKVGGSSSKGIAREPPGGGGLRIFCLILGFVRRFFVGFTGPKAV